MVGWLLIIHGAYVYIFSWFTATFLKTDIDLFDGSLRILTSLWPAAHFIPYKDFGFVYPPGYQLISYIFNVTTIQQRFIALLVIYLVLSGLIIYFSYRITGSLLSTAIILEILALEIGRFVWGDIIITALMFLVVLVVVFILKKEIEKGSIYYFLAIVSACTVLFRWDFPIFLGGLISLLAFRFAKCRLGRKILFAYLLGIISGFFVLFSTLFLWNAIKEGLEFIFIIPPLIAKSASDPPLLPEVRFNERIFPYFILFSLSIVLGIFLIKRYRYLVPVRKKENCYLFTNLFVILFPLAFFPYFLARPDATHGYIFGIAGIVSLGLILGVFSMSLKGKLGIIFLIVFSVSPYIRHLQARGSALLKSNLFLPDRVEYKISDCKSKVRGKNYNSIWVGRLDYNLPAKVRAPILYLVDISKKPATKYISDEAGLQINCRYATKIVEDFNKAERPILMFLEREIHGNFPKISCGIIEKWLSDNSYQDVGSCKIENGIYEIRIYN